MSWDPLNLPIDAFILADQVSPGLAEIVGASSPRKWDERKSYALSGASLVFRGVGLARFTARIRLYTPEHWGHWHAWKSLVVRPPAGERPKSLDIWHPILEEQGKLQDLAPDVRR